MAHYRVKYKGIGTHVTFIEGTNEADAITKVQSKYSFPLDSIRAKEIKIPGTEDYYLLRDFTWFLAALVIILGITILIGD